MMATASGITFFEKADARCRSTLSRSSGCGPNPGARPVAIMPCSLTVCTSGLEPRQKRFQVESVDAIVASTRVPRESCARRCSRGREKTRRGQGRPDEE